MKMKTKIDLVTGFLGAGKTTFLDGYINDLKKRSETVVLLENEFGKAGVDAELLNESGIAITQLTGGCICCGQKVNFHDTLILLSKEYDRILVEPSGIYTLEDFYDICESPKVKKCCEIDGIFMIVDPIQMQHLSQEQKEVFYSQAAGAGTLIVSKVFEGADYDKIRKEVCELLNKMFEEYDNPRRLTGTEILVKPWELLNTEDYLQLEHRGYVRNRINLKKQDHSTMFWSTTVSPVFSTYEKMEWFLKHLLDGCCGNIIRIKGYSELKSGEIWKINCSSDSWYLEEAKTGYQLGINIIGNQLNRRKIQELEKYCCE